jgi:hypothetical protein
MDATHSKRLAKLIPKDGGFDISFNLTNSGQQGKIASTLNLVIFSAAAEGKGPAILKKVSIPAIDDSIELFNMYNLTKELFLGVMFIISQAPFFLVGAVSAIAIVPAVSGFKFSLRSINGFALKYVERNEKNLYSESNHEQQ